MLLFTAYLRSPASGQARSQVTLFNLYHSPKGGMIMCILIEGRVTHREASLPSILGYYSVSQNANPEPICKATVL